MGCLPGSCSALHACPPTAANIGIARPAAARCCRPQVDSLAWVAPSAILVSCKLLTDGVEENFAPLAMLTWQGRAPAADNADLTGAIWWVGAAWAWLTSWLRQCWPVPQLPVAARGSCCSPAGIITNRYWCP